MGLRFFGAAPGCSDSQAPRSMRSCCMVSRWELSALWVSLVVSSGVVRVPLASLTALHPSRFEVGGEGLGLVDGDVGLQGDRHQVVYDVALDEAVGTPVVGKADGVQLLALEVVDGDAVGDEGLAVDLAPARRDGDPAGGVYAFLGGQLRADFAEEIGL